jgi:hypothetical protein
VFAFRVVGGRIAQIEVVADPAVVTAVQLELL